ncbi:hypothetical protein ACFL5V_06845 [Fibrobacterota bacterium]
MMRQNKNEAGVWIDRRKALAVRLYADPFDVTVIKSDLEGQVRVKGGSRSRVPYGPQETSSEKSRDKRFKHYMKKYLQAVITHFKKADRVLIMGPGETRMELRKEIAKSGSGLQVVKTEAADKMTAPQFASLVKRFFHD